MLRPGFASQQGLFLLKDAYNLKLHKQRVTDCLTLVLCLLYAAFNF